MAAIDMYKGFQRRPAGGPGSLVEVAPDDDNDLEVVAHWLHISQGGSLVVTASRGQTVTFENILPGWHAMEVSRVHATGTTATGIVAGW